MQLEDLEGPGQERALEVRRGKRAAVERKRRGKRRDAVPCGCRTEELNRSPEWRASLAALEHHREHAIQRRLGELPPTASRRDVRRRKR